MKKIVFVLMIFSVVCCKTNVKEKETVTNTQMEVRVDIKDCYNQLQKTTGRDDYISLSEKFKVSNCTDTKEWIPIYYSSYCLIFGAYLEENVEVKDSLLDEAQLLLDQCIEIDPNESEFYILQAYLYVAAMTADPIVRSRALGQKMEIMLERALQLNNNNPRAYYMQGSGIMHRPEKYGGGAKIALPILEEAERKFKTFKSDILYYPNWGEADNAKCLEECRKSN